MKHNMMPLITRVMFPVMAIAFIAAGRACAEPVLPALDWTERSDWVNVKTDVNPAAVGDGKADDTAALQKAFEKAEGSSGVLYMPAGAYRITQTIHSRRGARSQIAWIGHGRDTRITWDGETDKPMFVDHGLHNSRFVGVIFDGQDRAGTGFMYAGDSGFGTRLRFAHMGFVNLKFGLRNATDKDNWHGQAAAEVVYENCLFLHCSAAGALLTAQNYFNHLFTGCEFRDNGNALHFLYAQGYVWDSHFQNNRLDIFAAGEHGLSVRRCTSQGSGRFIEQARIDPMTIQDCAVSGWRGSGAILINGAWGAPTLLFDCAFSDPPTNAVAAISLSDTSPRQQVVLSNNRVTKGMTLLSGGQGEAWNVPAGKRDGVIDSASRSFLKAEVRMPGVSPVKIFDVVTEFGAVPNDNNDDTEAIQRAVDAARKQGHGALAYLPAGTYRVHKPIEITGSDYVVGGTLAAKTSIVWAGPTNALAVFLVREPRNVTLQHMGIGPDNQRYADWMSRVACVRQVGTGKPSSMHYDEVDVPGLYWERELRPVGFVLDGLGPKDLVDIDLLAGETRIVDSARANILIDYHYDGVIHVSGDKEKQRDGFLGIQFKLQTINPGYTVRIHDNQSLVLGDYYIEQTHKFLLLSGKPGDPDGRVVMQGPKLEGHYLTNDHVVITIDNYKGLVALGPDQFYGYWEWPEKGVQPIIQQTGDRPVDIVLMTTMSYPADSIRNKPLLKLGSAARLTMIANPWHKPVVSDSVKLEPVSRALDCLRELGAWDLRLNHSGNDKK